MWWFRSMNHLPRGETESLSTGRSPPPPRSRAPSHRAWGSSLVPPGRTPGPRRGSPQGLRSVTWSQASPGDQQLLTLGRPSPLSLPTPGGVAAPNRTRHGPTGPSQPIARYYDIAPRRGRRGGIGGAAHSPPAVPRRSLGSPATRRAVRRRSLRAGAEAPARPPRAPWERPGAAGADSRSQPLPPDEQSHPGESRRLTARSAPHWSRHDDLRPSCSLANQDPHAGLALDLLQFLRQARHGNPGGRSRARGPAGSGRRSPACPHRQPAVPPRRLLRAGNDDLGRMTPARICGRH